MEALTGYPLMVKASMGGGGRGLHVVRNDQELLSQMEVARREALSSFGNGEIFLEKYIERPHHIEFQILADKHGNIIHLGERDCSIQRRHQKLIEIAPSLVLDKELRARMGEAAIAVSKAVRYDNAGTVEFILDQNRNSYFIEMNTRIQVEHPVTEQITAITLLRSHFEAGRFDTSLLKLHPKLFTYEDYTDPEDLVIAISTAIAAYEGL